MDLLLANKKLRWVGCCVILTFGVVLLLLLQINTNPVRNDGRFTWWISDDPNYSSKRRITVDDCKDDLDCSLNGICQNNKNRSCICDAPWSGSHCDILEFEPTSFPQGYGMIPNHTTWGGGILIEHVGDDVLIYHLYVVRITNNCLLEDWTHNSRIDHAVSTNPTGPYQFVDVAIPTQSHNPVPLALPDGTYAIVHIGSGQGNDNGGTNCSAAATAEDSGDDSYSAAMRGRQRRLLQDSTSAAAATEKMGSTIHVSKSLNGPWRPLLNHTLDSSCNNPAPFVHPNGTVYVACRYGKEQTILKRADSIAGPYTDVSNLPTHMSKDVNATDDYYVLEDPQLYLDHRGHFHGIFHAYHSYSNENKNNKSNNHGDHCEQDMVAAHMYSIDGYTWHMSSHAPYGTSLELEDGTYRTLATRERPKPVFTTTTTTSTAAAIPRMTHLVQAVCGSPSCYSPTGCVNCKYKNWDFTLVSALKH
eukprot:scaffold1376_cov125-Cylindrotheca_fusiformis.AAC.6